MIEMDDIKFKAGLLFRRKPGEWYESRAMKSKDVYHSPSRPSGTSTVIITAGTTGESCRGTRDLQEELGLRGRG